MSARHNVITVKIQPDAVSAILAGRSVTLQNRKASLRPGSVLLSTRLLLGLRRAHDRLELIEGPSGPDQSIDDA